MYLSYNMNSYSKYSYGCLLIKIWIYFSRLELQSNDDVKWMWCINSNEIYSFFCIKIKIPIWKKNPTTKLMIWKEWMWYLHFFHLSDSELQVFIYLGIYKFECQHRYIHSFLVCEILKRYQITASAFILIFQFWVIKKI